MADAAYQIHLARAAVLEVTQLRERGHKEDHYHPECEECQRLDSLTEDA